MDYMEWMKTFGGPSKDPIERAVERYLDRVDQAILDRQDLGIERPVVEVIEF